jgi:hypothetical protein
MKLLFLWIRFPNGELKKNIGLASIHFTKATLHPKNLCRGIIHLLPTKASSPATYKGTYNLQYNSRALEKRTASNILS